MADVKECTFLSMLPYSIFTSHSTVQYWGTSVRNTNLSENVITILSLMENKTKQNLSMHIMSWWKGEIQCYKDSCFDFLFPLRKLEATSVFKSLPVICN